MIVHVLSATIAVYFFGFLFNIRGRQLCFSALGGGLAAFVYELGIAFNVNLMLTLFSATLCFSIYSEIMARILKTTVTTFAISGLIPLQGNVYDHALFSQWRYGSGRQLWTYHISQCRYHRFRYYGCLNVL